MRPDLAQDEAEKCRFALHIGRLPKSDLRHESQGRRGCARRPQK